MNERTRTLELRVRDGRAAVAGLGDARGGSSPRLPVSMVRALHEWAHIAQAVAAGGSSQPAELVSRRGRQLAARLAAETGLEVRYVDPVTGAHARIPVPGTGNPHESGWTRGSTPWATGVTLAVIVAGLIAVALAVVSLGLSEVNIGLAIGVNLAVAAGFAPSVWLARTAPVWRWVASGVTAGILATWFALLLNLLG